MYLKRRIHYFSDLYDGCRRGGGLKTGLMAVLVVVRRKKYGWLPENHAASHHRKSGGGGATKTVLTQLA